MKHFLRKNFFDRSNKTKILIIVGMFFLILVILIPFSLAADVAISSVEVKSENLNYDNKESGSFKITKSAKWISKGRAEITFSVDSIKRVNDNQYTDIILVLDISSSMNGEKLDRVKSDSVELINDLLVDSNNKVALITFDTTSNIVLDFTNNKDELISKIEALEVGVNTNYYRALVNVDNILKDYKKEQDKDVITLFLTDGYPNQDTSNEVGQYEYLKTQYPYMIINAVQYEMGSDILEPIKKISDYQYVADVDTLNNVLFDASEVAFLYDEFSITDYIDSKYFDISNENDIKVSQGSVTLTDDNSKVNWEINEFRSGDSVQMKIKATLKDEYLNTEGVYSTNTKEEIKSLIDNDSEDVVSTLTPILANKYQVIYDENAPDDCTVENTLNTESHFVFDTVSISDEKPICSGYSFKGWKIVTKDVSSVNDDYFIMPEKDVTLRAEWSKISAKKSMEGKVYIESNLYKMIAQNSSLDNTSSEFVSSSTGINFNNPPSDTNGKGIYELSSTKDDEYPVYYYRGNVTNNNVKFANFCWKIVRTTSTGGVKLIYNGVIDSDGGCDNTGEDSQIGKSSFNSNYTSMADVGYMYGTRYETVQQLVYSGSDLVFGNDVTYSNGVYTLKDTMTSSSWPTDYKTIATKYHYTCFSTSNTCSDSVYYINYFGDSNYAYYLTLTGGKDIEDAKAEMFTNTNNSTIKTAIDTWYQDNMTGYTSKLEDTVWCNDRGVSGGPLKGKDEDSSTITYTTFSVRDRNQTSSSTPSVVCQNKNDSFTVNSTNGNGALTYPVALLTADEATLAGHGSTGYSSSSYLYTKSYWWVLSPNYFGTSSFQFVVYTHLHSHRVGATNGVRPSVSLQPGIMVISGDGSTLSPYVIE